MLMLLLDCYFMQNFVFAFLKTLSHELEHTVAALIVTMTQVKI